MGGHSAHIVQIHVHIARYHISTRYSMLLKLLKKLRTSYNSALRRFLVISKPYSASQMFVSRGILSFDELLRKSIYRFVERIDNSTNSIIHACLSSSVFLYSPIRKWWSSLLYL